jgi:hypothetical protein
LGSIQTQDIDENDIIKDIKVKIDSSTTYLEESSSEHEAKLKAEQREENKIISKNYKAVRRFFYDKKDGKEYGLYKTVYDELGIDLELKQDDSISEKLDKLKLLKMICCAEKIGVYESIKYDKYRFPEIVTGKVPLIRIIKNPNINIIDGYGFYSDFTDEFYIIYKNVRNQVENADEIEDKIKSIHLRWNGVINSIKNEAAVSKSVSSGAEIIHNFILEGNHNKIQDYIPDSKQDSKPNKKTGVMEQFFIKLATVKFRAEINGNIKLYTDENKNDSLSKKLSSEFIEEYIGDSFYNERKTIDEFWNIVYKRGSTYDNEQKLKIWKLIMLNESPEIDLLKKKDNFKFKNRCLRLAMIWKMTNSKKNFEMRIDEWCIVMGALIEILDRNDKFETYDKSGYKTNKSFRSAVKSLDKGEKRTTHSDAALRIYLSKRYDQIYTDNELVNKRDRLIRDVYILENQVMSYNTFDEIFKINSSVFFEVELYSVSDAVKKLMRYKTQIKLNEEVKKRNRKLAEVGEYQIVCEDPVVKLRFWSFYYKSIKYELKDCEETAQANLKIYSEHYESLRNRENYDALHELLSLNSELKSFNTTSSKEYGDAIIERFAGEICRAGVTKDEKMKFTHSFQYLDGSDFEVEVCFSVHKKAGFIGIYDFKFNEKSQ